MRLLRRSAGTVLDVHIPLPWPRVLVLELGHSRARLVVVAFGRRLEIDARR